MLTRLARAQQCGHPVSFSELRTTCGGSEDVVESILGEMREKGWVARTDEQTWVLAIAPELLTIQAVIRHFALDPAQWLKHARPGGAQVAGEHLETAISAADMTLLALAGPTGNASGNVPRPP